MSAMEFEVFEQYAEMNNQALMNMNNMIKRAKEESEINAINKAVELIDELKTEVSIVKNENKLLKNELNETKDDVNKIKSKIEIFKYDDTGLFKKYKEAAITRVHNIVGKKGSVKYILFYDSFVRKLYSDIYKYFDASNSGNIKMEDAQTAIGMAKKWRPTDKYINKKLDEYVRSGKKLKEPKRIALEEYLIMTNGGLDIEF